MLKKKEKKMHYTFYGSAPKVFCGKKGVKPVHRTRIKKLVTCKDCKKFLEKNKRKNNVIITRLKHDNNITIWDASLGEVIYQNENYYQLINNRWVHRAGIICTMYKTDFKKLFNFIPKQGSKQEIFMQILL